MEYQAVVLPEAEADLERLSPPVRETIVKRIQWLAKNAQDVIHHLLAGMPDDLRGLCKFRVGDYRVLYWKADSQHAIQVFRVKHRSAVYRRL